MPTNMIHTPCGAVIATSPLLLGDEDSFKAEDWTLASGGKPAKFDAIVCPACNECVAPRSISLIYEE